MPEVCNHGTLRPFIVISVGLSSTQNVTGMRIMGLGACFVRIVCVRVVGDAELDVAELRSSDLKCYVHFR